jgi:hypothetical protein
MLRTTIATLASQTSFTLTAGSAENDTYNNCTIIVTDIASAVQKAVGRISDYTGASKTVTLAADPGIFTMAAKDRVHIFATSALANVDAYQSVLAVANAIPAAAADAAGGLPVSDAGGLDLDAIKTETAVIQAFWNVFILTSGTIGSTGNDTTHLHLTGQVYGDDDLNDYILVVYDVSNTRYHSSWITDWVNSTALATVDTLPFTPQDATDQYWIFATRKHPDLPTKAEMDAAHALLATPAQVNTQVDGAWTTQMADSVPADGTISTREQALYAILQMLTEFAISGTTMTVKKVDGSTSLMTFTLDNGTNPTSLTRAT